MNSGQIKALAAALLTASAVLAASAAPARADVGPGDENTGVVVAHRDLDLARPEGRAVLDGRLRAAARAVCGAPEREEVRAYFARRDCYQQSIARAIRDSGVGRQLVAAVQ
jgi:UrcA family protein